MPAKIRKRKSKSTGRREALAAEMASRPARALEMLSDRPMTVVQVAEAFGMASRWPAGGLLTTLFRAGQVRRVSMGVDVLWVALDTPADTKLAQIEAEHRAEMRRRLVERNKAATKRYRMERMKQVKAEAEERWLHPTKRVLEAGSYTVTIPPMAVRSVFDLGAR